MPHQWCKWSAAETERVRTSDQCCNIESAKATKRGWNIVLCPARTASFLWTITKTCFLCASWVIRIIGIVYCWFYDRFLSAMRYNAAGCLLELWRGCLYDFDCPTHRTISIMKLWCWQEAQGSGCDIWFHYYLKFVDWTAECIELLNIRKSYSRICRHISHRENKLPKNVAHWAFAKLLAHWDPFLILTESLSYSPLDHW